MRAANCPMASHTEIALRVDSIKDKTLIAPRKRERQKANGRGGRCEPANEWRAQRGARCAAALEASTVTGLAGQGAWHGEDGERMCH
eukprot:4488785-Prymnesium_polylepis.1